MTTVYTILTVFGALLVWIYAQTVNGVFRAKAKERPRSYAAMMLRLVDPILDSTLFREAESKLKPLPPQEQLKMRYTRELNNLYGSDELVVVNNAIVVSIDFTRVISERLLRYMGNPIVHIVIISILSSLVSFFAASLIAELFLSAYREGIFIVLTFGMFFIMLNLLGRDGGFLSTLFKLRYWPNVLVIIDHRLVFMEGAWFGHWGHVAFNDGTAEFCVVDAEQSTGIAWRDVNSGKQMPIFLIPKSFLDMFFPDDKLQILCVNLNELLGKSKNFDKPN